MRFPKNRQESLSGPLHFPLTFFDAPLRHLPDREKSTLPQNPSRVPLVFCIAPLVSLVFPHLFRPIPVSSAGIRHAAFAFLNVFSRSCSSHGIALRSPLQRDSSASMTLRFASLSFPRGSLRNPRSNVTIFLSLREFPPPVTLGFPEFPPLALPEEVNPQGVTKKESPRVSTEYRQHSSFAVSFFPTASANIFLELPRASHPLLPRVAHTLRRSAPCPEAPTTTASLPARKRPLQERTLPRSDHAHNVSAASLLRSTSMPRVPSPGFDQRANFVRPPAKNLWIKSIPCVSAFQS